MDKNKDFLKVKALYDREITRDMIEIETDKVKFIKEMKAGLGEKINDIESYKKPNPTIFKIFITKIKKILGAL
jgi:hypothetical protein